MKYSYQDFCNKITLKDKEQTKKQIWENAEKAESPQNRRKKAGCKLIAANIAVAACVLGLIALLTIEKQVPLVQIDPNITMQATENMEQTPENTAIATPMLPAADEWVYYPSRSWEGLYRAKLDGAQMEKVDVVTGTGRDDLKDNYGVWQVEIQDDWVYYSLVIYNNNPEIEVPQANYIFRMKTNGTELTKLHEKYSSRIGIPFCVEEDWIYWMERDGVYKMHLDGSEKTTVHEMSVTWKRALAVHDGQVYYAGTVPKAEYPNRTRAIFQSDLAGASNAVFLDTDNKGVEQIAFDAYANEDWLYFHTWDVIAMTGDRSRAEAILQRIHTGTGERRELLKMEYEQASHFAGGWIVADGWIYYLDNNATVEGPVGSICRIRTDGTDKTKLSDDFGSNLYLYKGVLFYSVYDATLRRDILYRMNADGSERRQVGAMEYIYPQPME